MDERTTDNENVKEQQLLPDELWEKILGNVDDNSVMAFASVCKQLRRVQRRSGRKLETDMKSYSDFSVERDPELLSWKREAILLFDI